MGREGRFLRKRSREDDFWAFRKRSISQLSVARGRRVPGASALRR